MAKHKDDHTPAPPEVVKIEDKEREQQSAKVVAADKPGNEREQPKPDTVTDPVPKSDSETIADLRKKLADAEAKVPKAKDASNLPRWNCSIPNDPTAPRRTVHAQTAGDAERVYKEECGIIASEHPISVGRASDDSE